MTDTYAYAWFSYLNAKLDWIIHKLDDPDPQKLAALVQHVKDKAAALQAAVDAQPPSPH